MNRLRFMEEELSRRRESRRLRKLRRVTPVDGAYVEVDGKRLLNVCSNDYLGLAHHPLLVKRAAEFMERYGAGSTASRLVCGNYGCFEDVERKLAQLKKTEAALLLPTGYQANATLLPAICDRNSLILSDRLNHNSIISGCALARCTVMIFEHNDTGHLEKLLAQNRNKGFSRIVIVT
ncbi:MAG: 8-amino-7-oxononanoate synthase, partial [Deltaproteobacteria bacterium]